MTKFCSLVLCVVLLAAGPVPAQPQCVFDGFDITPCCQIPVPTLPTIPNLTFVGTWARICGCAAPAAPFGPGVSSQWRVTINTALLPIPGTNVPTWCDTFILALGVVSAGPVGGEPGPTFAGNLLAKYSRTWCEFGPGPVYQGQVWRFLLHGDVVFANAVVPGPTNCPPGSAPPCQSTFQAVHLVGSIDFFLPANGPWTARIDLTHHQDCISHGVSLRPLGVPSHVNTSYHLMGPNPVVFTPVPPVPIPFTAAFVRETALPNPGVTTPDPICFGASPVTNFSPFAVAATFCSASAPPARATHASRTFALMPTLCGGAAGSFALTPLNLAPLIPAALLVPGAVQPFITTGDVSIYIGRHTAPAGTFPSGLDVWSDMSVQQVFTNCLGASPSGGDQPNDILTGVTTSYASGGSGTVMFPPTSPGVAYTTMTDWMNHRAQWQAPGNPTYLTTFGAGTLPAPLPLLPVYPSILIQIQ